MNVKNCKKCGRLYNYITGVNLCPSCKEGLEGKFKEVKAYIQEHRGCGIQEVSDECEVETAQIRQWIREERLEFAEDSMIGLACEICGATIRTGRYCEKCKAQTLKGLNNIVRSAQPATPTAPNKDPKDNPKMRFL